MSDILDSFSGGFNDGSGGGLDSALLSGAMATGNPFAVAGALTIEGIEKILPKIGSGRKEADVIVPVQNQLNQVLVQVNNEWPTASLDRLYVLKDTVQKDWTAFSNWIQGQQWTDGRAAQQALDQSKDPYRTTFLTIQNIQGRINALNSGTITPDTVGAPGTSVPPTGGTPGATPVAGNSSLLTYAGVGLIGAKLLGWL